MKKHQRHSRRSLHRTNLRQARRLKRAGYANVRKLSRHSVPWDPWTDNCQFRLMPESYSAEPMSGATDPLDALDERFRECAGWTRLTSSDPKSALNVIIGMCRPAPEFVTGSECRFVAVDPNTYNGEAVFDRKIHQEFWDHQMNGRPVSMPFLKSGLAIWRKLGIKVDPEDTAYMMQMKSVDAETSEALQAAIFSTFNTARHPIDVEAVNFALATFMHADPLRKHLVEDDPFIEPYGDRTAYGLCKFLKPTPATDDDDKDG